MYNTVRIYRGGQEAMPGRGGGNAILHILHYFPIVKLTHPICIIFTILRSLYNQYNRVTLYCTLYCTIVYNIFYKL